jgi:tetratricopeptide (TPR) repeat protein
MVRNNAWKRPMYYAVTVPNENIGQWQPFLDMEGLIFRITPEASEDGLPTFNSAKIWKNFTEVYDFESVLDEDGNRRTDIFRDHNSRHLLNNYPVALCRVGYTEALAGNYGLAIEAAEMAYRFNPTFPLVVEVLPLIYLQAGQIENGVEAANRLFDQLGLQQRVDMSVRVGEALLTLREDGAALRWAQSRIEREPDEASFVQLLAQSQLLSGNEDSAVQTLEDWVDRTGDPNARRELDILREEIRRARAEDSDSNSMDGTSP